MKYQDLFNNFLLNFGRGELQRLFGYSVSETSLQKVASLAQRLFSLQSSDHEAGVTVQMSSNGCIDDLSEFGININFQAPERFLVDISSENGVSIFDGSYLTSVSIHEEGYDESEATNHHSVIDKNVNLRWLKDACDMIVKKGGSQLSGDELAMALCRVLESDKAGDEVLMIVP